MRRVWLNALAVTAAISFGACAAGTIDSSLAFPGDTTRGDAGDSAPQSNSSDAGSPPSDDAGQPVPPPSPDAATGSGDDGGDGGNDGGGTPAVDSGGVGSDDSGGPTTAANCNKSSPNFSKETGEFTAEGIAGTGTSCSGGPAACKASECCYIPVVVIPLPASALCVPL